MAIKPHLQILGGIYCVMFIPAWNACRIFSGSGSPVRAPLAENYASEQTIAAKAPPTTNSYFLENTKSDP